MKTVLIASICLAVAYAVSAREIPNEVGARIVGGSNAAPAKYPYQVSLRVYFKHFCGGSVLNNRWILTAAHCVYTKRPDEISVIGGTNLLSEAGQMYQALYKYEHPNYDDVTKANDIALLYVSRDISLKDKVRAINLPKSNIDKSISAILTGWGSKSVEGGPLTLRLQKVDVNLITQKDCKTKLSSILNSQLCTLNKDGQGFCSGDGGGPLVVEGTQVGIASFNDQCAKGKPNVYTRVWSYLDWINKTIKDQKP